MTDLSPSSTPRIHQGLLAGPTGQVAVGVSIVVLMAALLDLMGRPVVCDCGTIALWDGDPHSPGSSQQFSDWYSALHVVYGIGLFLALRHARPHWPTSWLLLTTLASSAIWEVAENTPWIIAMFGQAVGAPDYHGDSVLNAIGDTVFVVVGFFAARALPLLGTIGLVVALELAIALAIGDGFVLGTLRLLGVSVPPM
ncbi:DUF2585 family protein [Aureimonas sp. ME7]|uniref:DUF2585 family protein n=1 Tax=Aureimonas sp. ME7 TaxID=2744252 RepID=UPI0015F4C006|nr:DUF2585 family protein [Aureimonas sp. ME7]